MSEPVNVPHSDTKGSADPLSFDKVDLGKERKPTICASCKQPITDTYFEVNGLVACPPCHDQLIATRGGGSDPQVFMRALLFGLVGAIAGSAIWMAVTELTGYAIGLVAIGVGLVVGLAVKKGARGGRGVPYQALAVLLTYVAIASARMPLIIKSVDNDFAQQNAVSSPTHSAHHSAGNESEAPTLPHDVGFLWSVFVLALELPFRMATKQPISLLILGFALFEAWKLNKLVPLEITGPLRVSLPRGAAPA